MAGGEIFVPKLPSMKIVDVANAVVPGASHRFVGIRPGEKLHEIMITRDDAANALEFDDFYVVRPAFSWWEQREADNGGFKAGRPVADGFQYSSDTNDRWLDADAFRAMVGLAPAPVKHA
jgi:UDP-N-acetylglucosamine 4,6-dehydratase